MNQVTLSKIEAFSNIASPMKSSFKKVVEDWSPELPPVTVLFAELARSFMNNFHLFDYEQRRIVFKSVETMLTRTDQELDIGASTGFLEALVVSPNFSKAAKEMLGEESRSFLKAWNEALGIQDDDL